jgi:hypothetical protein
MNFYKGIFGRWVSGFGLLMALSGSVLAQGPWNFQDSNESWTAKNSSVTAGSEFSTWTLAGSGRYNRLSLIADIDSSLATNYLAITIQNETENDYIQLGLTTAANGNSNWGYVSARTQISVDQSSFSTVLIDLSASGKWNGSNTITGILLRMRNDPTAGDATSYSQGDIKIKKMELVSVPTMTIESTTSGVTDGSTTSDSSIALKFTASEATSNFVVGDITISGGTISNFSATSSTVYTATLTPSASEAYTVDVSANAFSGTSETGNSATDQFNWTYSANNIPVISLIGSQSVEVALGATYTDQGATASDTEDGSRTSSITTVGATIDTSVRGTHVVTYNVKDSQNASAAEVVRTVTVAPFNFDNSKDGWSGGSSPLQLTVGDSALKVTLKTSKLQDSTSTTANNYPNLDLATGANINPKAGP